MGELIGKKSAEHWYAKCPLLKDITSLRPSFWFNQSKTSFDPTLSHGGFTPDDVADAAARLGRFRPYLAEAFSETAEADGLIESPLRALPQMQKELEELYGSQSGNLYVKLDSHLPISGSVKARGGIYQVLKIAESIALTHGLLDITKNYAEVSSAAYRQLFARHCLVVGSTGNLGLSIGIIGKKLGFKVIVHMSADAKQWKKDRLRSLGVSVVEHDADYSVAVAEGRAEAEADAHSFFIDDEDSRDLFLGYAVAGERLRLQLEQQHIAVNENNPLVVYLPCGVGGGPGGISYGLKLAFGDNVHCFFCEPTQAPAMLVSLATGLNEKVAATDFGIVNRTIADGLAVSRASGLVCRAMQHLLSGIFTVEDEEMYQLLSLLSQSEKLRLEPSALVGFSGYRRSKAALESAMNLSQQDNITHLVWATGGSMVPESVWLEYNKVGIEHIEKNRFV